MAIELWRPGGPLTRGRFGELTRLEREMEEMFGRFLREWPFGRSRGEVRGWSPAVDMIDRKEEVLLRADLPGLTEKDIEVTVENNVLTVRGERKEERESKEEDFYCCERWAGSFSRSLMLPPGVDPNRVSATFKKGVLEIRLPKTKESKGKKIPVKASK